MRLIGLAVGLAVSVFCAVRRRGHSRRLMRRRLGKSDIVLLILLVGLLLIIGSALLGQSRFHAWRPTFSTAVWRSL
jgi:hypothetical protein